MMLPGDEELLFRLGNPTLVSRLISASEKGRERKGRKGRRKDKRGMKRNLRRRRGMERRR